MVDGAVHTTTALSLLIRGVTLKGERRNERYPGIKHQDIRHQPSAIRHQDTKTPRHPWTEFIRRLTATSTCPKTPSAWFQNVETVVFAPLSCC